MGITKVRGVSYPLLMSEAALFIFNLGSIFFLLRNQFLSNNVTIFPLYLAVQEGGSGHNKNHCIERLHKGQVKA